MRIWKGSLILPVGLSIVQALGKLLESPLKLSIHTPHDPEHPTAYGPTSSPCLVSMPVTKLERVEMRRNMFPTSPDPEDNSPKQLDTWD